VGEICAIWYTEVKLIVEAPGTLLKRARQLKVMDQVELAVLAGTSQSYVSRVENEKISPSLATFVRLLLATDASIRVEVRVPLIWYAWNHRTGHYDEERSIELLELEFQGDVVPRPPLLP
jgi:transcriptional regulator with XRE-family HTH domain